MYVFFLNNELFVRGESVMSVLDYAFILVSLFWLLELFLFRNRQKEPSPYAEQRSFYLILLTLSLSILFSLLFSSTDQHVFWKVIGLSCLGGGVFLRYWGILHLKQQFTRHVTVNTGDRLVSTGPYRTLRHPLYTGLLFITIGFPLFFGNGFVTLGAGLVMFFMLRHRIRIEEALLTAGFGPAYTEWAMQRKRLIPFIY